MHQQGCLILITVTNKVISTTIAAVDDATARRRNNSPGPLHTHARMTNVMVCINAPKPNPGEYCVRHFTGELTGLPKVLSQNSDVLSLTYLSVGLVNQI